MLSFPSVLGAHAPLLWIDSASTKIQVGVLRANHSTYWTSCTEEAGIGIFSCTQKTLLKTGLELSSMGAFVFCHGPGSVLGIRLAAVAVRTWCVLQIKPVFAYSSLILVAEALARSEKAGNFRVIADARRDTWHEVEVDAKGEPSPLQRVATTELRGPLVMPDAFKHWAPLPPNTRRVDYNVAELLAQVENAPLLQATGNPDAFLHEEPSYQKWTPQIHRAPA